MESLSTLLMEAGRSIPQHLGLAVLYTRSKELQSFITEYFIVVVQLCHRFYAHSQKSIIRKITSSLDDADIKEYQSRLVAWSKSIREEIDLLVAHRIEEEAKENSRFRGVMIQASKVAAQREKLAANQKYIDSVSVYDYETTWRQLRKKGNTACYTASPAYRTWKEDSSPRTLVFSGKLGAGKSIMLANIVDDLVLHVKPEFATVTYFFCKHDLPDSLYAKTVMGALFRQILLSFVNTSEDFGAAVHTFNHADWYKSPQMDPPNNIIWLLHRVVPKGHHIYFVLDGLDLCSRSEQTLIAQQLQKLQQYVKLVMCVSQRQEPGVGRGAFEKYFPTAAHVPLPDNASEIDDFIAAELECYLSDGTLVLGDPALILDIHTALSEGSQGMFLWVALQIQSLRSMRTDAALRDALLRLPRDLSELYAQLVERSQRSERPYQKHMFQLMLAAKRPLTIDEMREALSVTPGDTDWSASKLINDVYSVLASCGCLICVDEEERTIRTIHPSVDQFLLKAPESDSSVRDSITFTEAAAQQLMVATILTYLDYSVFGMDVAIRAPRLDLGEAPTKVIRSTLSASRVVQGLALKLLRARKEPAFDASEITENLKSRKPPTLVNFHFHSYAKAYGLKHVQDVPELSTHEFKTITSLLRQEFSDMARRNFFLDLLKIAIEHDNLEMVEHLCSARRLFEVYRAAPTMYMKYGDLFRRAIREGLTQAAKGYINACCRLREEVEGSRITELNASRSRAVDVWSTVESLLGPTPLQYALECHQNEILKSLIDSRLANINAPLHEYGGAGKPISFAIDKRNDDAVLSLLCSGRVVFEKGELSSMIERTQRLGLSKITQLLVNYDKQDLEIYRQSYFM